MWSAKTRGGCLEGLRRRHSRHQGGGARLRQGVRHRGGGGRRARRCRNADGEERRRRQGRRRGSLSSGRRGGRARRRRPRCGHHRDGGGADPLPSCARRYRGRPRPRRLRQHGARHRGDAGASDRRAEAHGLDRRVGQYRALCRPERHRDDVLGRGRGRAQRHLAPGDRQRRPCRCRHGAEPRWRVGGRPTGARPHHVRRDDRMRDAGARGA